jgi:hypothetical protein
MLQFRPAGKTYYGDVEWVWIDNAHPRTTVIAQRSGTWRYVYFGNSFYGPAKSAGVTVIVRPKHPIHSA